MKQFSPERNDEEEGQGEETRQKEKEERKKKRDKKAMYLSRPHLSDTLLERHCFLKREFFSQSNRCGGLIIILTVCSTKVQTLIYTITLLKYRHLPLFSHI